MNCNTSNNNIKNQILNKNLSFNDKKSIVEGFIKIKKYSGNQNISNIEPEKKLEEKNGNISNKKDDFCDGFDIIDNIEINSIKNNESQKNDLENDYINLYNPFSKSSTYVCKEEIDLWKIIPISKSIKKIKKNDIMQNLVSTIFYNGPTFKDKLNESSSKKSIIIFDKIENNYTPKLLKKVQNSFIYMSYRTGLVNTSFLPGGNNNYTSDCGWGCMLRCSQMMLSRGFIMKKIYDFKKKNPNKEINMNKIRKEIITLFYDKFLKPENLWINEEIGEIYKKLLKNNVEVSELIPPYSIYILTLLGQCPNVFTSDNKMISCFLKINKTLFSESIKILHFKEGIVYKKKLFKNFCKIDNQEINNEKYIEYNSEKYIFDKGGLIFISVRLGLYQIESNFIKMIPKIFINIHNNIGFISGKKKRAFYFIGMSGDKLIFADPHFNQNLEEDEINFPTYLVNDLFLISIKELCSQITIGVGINSKEELEQFILDMQWFNQICPGLIEYKE